MDVRTFLGNRCVNSDAAVELRNDNSILMENVYFFLIGRKNFTVICHYKNVLDMVDIISMVRLFVITNI